MATNSEKIDELFRLVDQLAGRVDRIERELERVAEWVEKLRAADADSQRRLALLERQHTDWTKSSEVWGQRSWTILVAVVSMILGGIITYLVRR